MIPLLPAHALPFFGPTPGATWGGVPWDQCSLVTPSEVPLIQRPWKNLLALFPGNAVIVTGTVDDDCDGPGGSLEIDPCYDPTTSLRWPGGLYVNSRTFRGMVMHRIIEDHGGGLGDFGLCCWGGTIHAVQYYDIGPKRKLQEGSEKTLRDFGVIEPGQSSRHAAVVGNDVQDFCSLIFPGSAPKDIHGVPYAVEQDEMILRTLTLWGQFTSHATAPTNPA